YYHRSRTHLGLQKDTPESRPIQAPEATRIVAIPEVGGFIIGTSVAPREARSQIVWSHSNQLLYSGFIEGQVRPPQDLQAGCAGSENRLGCCRALVYRVSENHSAKSWDVIPTICLSSDLRDAGPCRGPEGLAV